jgi:uncharacterized protein (DUF362 family)
MSYCTRRDFLVRSATAAGLAALPAGSMLADAAKPNDMTIARWATPNPDAAQLKDIATKLTEKAIEGLGGIKRFVGNGSIVWIKPNIGWDRKPELAANTNPDVVATLIRLCFEAGAKKVKVGDNPCNPAIKTYESSGIAPAARALGAEVVFLDRSRFKDTAIGGERVKTIPIYPEFLECDLVINVPVVKHHVLASMTMCMKNYMGVIENRKSFHQDLPTCICDITQYMKPRLCVLDAMRVLTAHGPVGGKLEDVQLKTTVAAGVDIVALDALGAEIMGRKPADIGSIVKAQAVGLGKMDYRSLALREFAVS